MKDVQRIVVCDDTGLSLQIATGKTHEIAVLFIHGLGDDSAVWSGVLSKLPDVQSICVDLRGHGESDWDKLGAYRVVDHVGDLRVVLKKLQLKRAVLVGHSMGADIAIRLALRQPDCVVGVVVVDYGPEIGRAGVDHIHRELEQAPSCFVSREEYRLWLAARRPLAQAALLDHLAGSNLRETEQGRFVLKGDRLRVGKGRRLQIASRGDRYTDVSLWEDLRQLKCPALLVRGVASAILPADVARRMANEVAIDGRLAVVGSAGHAVMLDNPNECGAAIREFIQSL